VTTQPADWVDRLADEVIADAQRRAELGQRDPAAPIVCASGLSPSGPIHLGNLREVMVPHLVADEIRRRGIACEHLISWDDYDRFRKVPGAIPGIDAWNAHIGKPLSSVPPPPGSPHASWAEHFRVAMTEALSALGVPFRGISQTRMYTTGSYRDQVLLAMRQRAVIDEVLGRYRTKAAPGAPAQASATADVGNAQEAEQAQGSGAATEDDGSGTGGAYYPFKPYCTACGTDFTTVIEYDEDTTELIYRCAGPGRDGNPGECGNTGVMHLDRDFHGKLVWKVDWPMRWAYEGVIFEPSGVDHQSPGSSYVVGGQVVQEVFGGWQPIGPMYAFVGISGMAKMSSSKGGVPTPADALSIMEPHVLRWLYARRRPHQSFTVAFDHEILRLYDEWDALERKVASGKGQPGDVAAYARSVGTAQGELRRTPRPLPYRALCSVVDLTGSHEAQMLRILTSMDPRIESLDQVGPRLELARTWVQSQADPSDRTVVLTEPDVALLTSLPADQREALDSLARQLDENWTLDGLTALVYGIPKVQAGLSLAEKKLSPEVKAAQRAFFATLYQLLLGADTGPRLPTLLLCLGPHRVRRLIGAAVDSADQAQG
jgi:lysyl-tRNA synthetase class 1